MNKHLHRVVFNKRRGQLMAVAEIAASDGKAAGVTELPAQSMPPIQGHVIATLRASAYGALLSIAAVLVLIQPAHAQISADAAAPANQRPTVLAAPNGVPLVNIQTPSAAGVSRNTYSQFDIGGGGAILNNSRINTQTQLGGWVQGNPWLATGSARVILNEVNSSNPSQLRGYVEVAGQRAEVIIANPAGIQVNGGGFINASGITLTTGTPVMNAGSLEGFRVQRGQVNIQGLGLDARTADFTSIYTRALQVNAGIWANNLAAVTGANQVAPGVADATPQATPIASSTAAPTFALDVGALGGMYAGKIHLIGTEAGLGVNMQGALAASAGSLVLQANGQLTNSGTIAASAAGQDLTIRTQGLANSGTLASQNNVVMEVGSGAIGNSGTVNAARELIASAGEITNSGTLAAGRLQLAATNLTNAAGRIEQSGSQVLAITAQDVSNTGAAALIGAQAAVNSGSGGSGGGSQTSDLSDPTPPSTSTGGGSTQVVVTPAAPVPLAAGSIQVDTLVNTGGQIVASGATALTSTQSLTNSGTVRVETLSARGTLDNNGGTLWANSLAVDVSSLSNRNASITTGGDFSLRSGALDNSAGQIKATGNLSIEAGAFTNAAGTTQAGGTLAINAADIDNTQGALYAGTDAAITARGALTSSGSIATGRNLVIAAQSIDSTGTLAAGVAQDGTLTSAGDLSIAATGTLRAGGSNLAAGTATLQGASVNLGSSTISAANLSVQATGGDIRTRAASIASAGQVTLTAAQALDNVGGTVAAQDALQVQAQAVDNAQGTLYGRTGLDLTAQTVTSSGTIASGLNARIQATLTNTGLVQAATDLELTGAVSNTGQLIAARTATLTGALTNSGLVQAATALGIDTQGAALVNTGSQGIVSGGDLSLRAGQLSNTNAAIAAEGALQIQAQEVRNTGGTVLGRAGLAVDSALLDNKGTVASGADAQIRAELTNSGTLQASDDLTLVGRVANTGQVLAGRSASLQGQLTNSGLVQAATALTVDTQGAALVNTGAQGLVSGGALSVDAGEINNAAGNMRAGAALNLRASGAVKNQAGLIASEAAITMTSQGLDNSGGLVQAAGDLRIDTGAQALANRNTAADKGLVAGGALTITANSLDNTSGRIAAVGSGGASLQVAGSIDNASGLITGNTDVTLSAASLGNASGSLSAGRDLNVSAGSLSQAGQLRAGRDLALVVRSNLTLDGDNLAASRDLTLDVSGDFVNNGNQTAAGNLTASASGAITNNANLSAGQTLSASAGTNLVNAGAIVGASVTLSAEQLVANRGPIALIGATDTAGTLQVLAPAIENSDDLTATNTAPSATILGLGNVVLAGGRDAQGNLTQATQITNRSALIESGGDMTLVAATVTNTRRQLVVSSSFDTPLTQAEADAAGISLSGQVGSPNTPDPNQIGGVYIEPPHGGAMNSDYLWTDYTGVAAKRSVLAISPKAQIIVGGNLDASAVGGLQNYWSDISAAGSIALGVAQVDQDSWRGAPQPQIQVNYSGTYQYRTYKGTMWTLPFADDIRYHSSPPNYDSTLTAGGTISGNGGSLTNGSQGAGTLPTGGALRAGAGGTLVTAPAQGAGYQQPTAVGSPQTAAAQPGAPAAQPVPAATVQVSPSALYHLSPSPASGYYIETDSRFTNYRQWLSSDYMLQALNFDPAATQKRLGDGFYEQRLVREQLLELTGKRFLGDFRDEDLQYQAMMNNAVTVATAFGLRPGVALTPEQMRLLTSDIVWLVEQEVTLPDGSRMRALVPQIYLAAGSAQLRPNGALVAANTIDLRNQQGINNGGTIAALGDLNLQSLSDINSQLGNLTAGGAMNLIAVRDIDLTSATLKSGSLTATAGRDFLLASGTQTLATNALGTQRRVTTVPKVASITVTGDVALDIGRDVRQLGADIKVGGNLDANVGRDWVAGTVQQRYQQSARRLGGEANADFVNNVTSTLQVGGDTAIQTGGDFQASGAQLQLGSNSSNTANIRAEGNIVLDAALDSQRMQQSSRTKGNANATSSYNEQVRGIQLTAAGSLTLSAGNDVVARAATVQVDGALGVTAGRDIVVGTAQETHSYTMQDSSSRRNAVSSRSRSESQSIKSELQKGSSFTGDNVSIFAGRDATIDGSQVSAKQALGIAAGRDLAITAAEERQSVSSYFEEKRSGFSATLGQVSVGKSRQDHTQTEQAVTQLGSQLDGRTVALVAGRDATIEASVVLADDNVAVLAGRDVNLTAAANTQNSAGQSHANGTTIGLAPTGLSGNFTIFGKTASSQDGTSSSAAPSTSVLSANRGDLTVVAGTDAQYAGTGAGNVVVQGADLLAAGKVTVSGNAVDLQAVQDGTASASQAQSNSFTVGAQALVGGMAVKGPADVVQDVRATDNKRLQGAVALKGGYDAYKFSQGKPPSTDAVTDAVNGKPPTAGNGGVGVSFSVGVSKSSQQQTQSSSNSRGTNIQADAIEITAREGDLTATGAKLQARDIALEAAGDLSLQAAANTAAIDASSSSRSTAGGVTLGSNGQQTGISFQASASKSQGTIHGRETTWDNTQVVAADTLTIKSGGDTQLKGAQLAGARVEAAIGGDLKIETLQDQSFYDSQQKSSGFSVSVCVPPLCVGAPVTGSVSMAKQTIEHNYQSALGQSGMAAGAGGFDIQVQGNTDLKGGAITSQADKDKNRLATESLTFSDLDNRQSTKAESYSVSAGYGGATSFAGTLASNALNNGVANLNGNAGLPASGSESSKTLSVISPAQVTITGGDAKSPANAGELTSRDAATANGSLTNTLTLQQAQALEQERKKRQENQQAASQVGAVLTNVIGDMALKNDWPEGSPQKLALHGIAGAIQAKIADGSLAAGIAGGMVQEKFAAVAGEYLKANGYDFDDKRLTPEARATLRADYNELMRAGATLAGAAVGAAVGGTDGAAIGANTALTGVTNNFLNHQQAADLKDEIAKCKAGRCQDEDVKLIVDKYRELSNQNIAAVDSCVVAGNVQCVQSLIGQAASGAAVDAALPIGWGSVAGQLAARQDNVNLYGSTKGKDSLFGTDVQQAQDVAAFRAANCAGISAAACDALVKQAIDDRYARAGALMAAGVLTPLAVNRIRTLTPRSTTPTSGNSPQPSITAGTFAAEVEIIDRNGTVLRLNSAKGVYEPVPALPAASTETRTALAPNSPPAAGSVIGLTRDSVGNPINVIMASDTYSWSATNPQDLIGSQSASHEGAAVQYINDTLKPVAIIDSRASNNNGFDPSYITKDASGNYQLVIVEDKSGSGKMTAFGEGARGQAQLDANLERLRAKIETDVSIPREAKIEALKQIEDRTFHTQLFVGPGSKLTQSQLDLLRNATTINNPVTSIVVLPKKN